ncbi:MAG: TIGR04211 family SH3 domain-containing protein [Gammaproteobacteria bacterium]|nr:TIGR04211 family SH3 domain-containing protein [Gammaproteobacteria bacterium]
MRVRPVDFSCSVVAKWRACALLALLLPLLAAAQDAENRWVTDSFEVTMRSGKSTRQSIVRMLASGTRVELLEVDAEAGYSRVRTRGGAEGWVLNRYLLRSPPARVTLPDVEQRLSASESKRRELQQSNQALEQETRQLKRRIAELESSGSDLQTQLSDIRRLSSNAIEVDEQNKQLRDRLGETERALTDLQLENQRLASRSSREWFVVGAAVVVFGVLLGLILPRIRWRKKSSWSDF